MTSNPETLKATTGELMSGVSKDLSTLIRDELRLAQAATTAKAKKVGLGLGLFGGAGLIVVFGVGALVAAAILGLATALHAWLPALIVGGGLLLVGAIVALFGKRDVAVGAPSGADRGCGPPQVGREHLSGRVASARTDTDPRPRPNAPRRRHLVVAAIAKVGVLVTAAAIWATGRINRDNEHRLLQVQTGRPRMSSRRWVGRSRCEPGRLRGQVVRARLDRVDASLPASGQRLAGAGVSPCCRGDDAQIASQINSQLASTEDGAR